MCRSCGETRVSVSQFEKGSFLAVTVLCRVCEAKSKWTSQPLIGDIPAGNALISAAILCSGSLVNPALRLMEFMNCATITPRTFYRIQNQYLHPAVMKVWKTNQIHLIEKMKAELCEVALAGDGRADSPGHCAKFGCYSLLEMTSNRIVDFQVVQVSNKYFLLILHRVFVEQRSRWLGVHGERRPAPSCCLSRFNRSSHRHSRYWQASQHREVGKGEFERNYSLFRCVAPCQMLV